MVQLLKKKFQKLFQLPMFFFYNHLVDSFGNLRILWRLIVTVEVQGTKQNCLAFHQEK